MSTVNDDDDLLWRRALDNHDAQAFRALVARHVRWVTAIIACHCHDDAVANIGTAVFQQAWRRLDEMPRQGSTPFAHWLLDVTRHECRGHLHRNPGDRRKPPQLDQEDWMVPERIAEAALLSLPSTQRELITAAQDGQQSYDRLCQIFHLRRPALERQLLQARQALAQSLTLQQQKILEVEGD
ncbi:MAG: sigma-70 family RNA polymerase sigma factor [Planctomycetota bacterium]|nr:MAG: sigma-70 family RNA polymerase sigma factor [Planctomycetota bacterium]